MESLEKKQAVRHAICYLKVNSDDIPIYNRIKEIERFCFEKYKINEWYIDSLGKGVSICPEFSRMIHKILETKDYCETIIMLDVFQISYKEYGRLVTKKILDNAGIELVTVNKKSSFQVLSMFDTMKIQLIDRDNNCKSFYEDVLIF